MSVLQVRSVLQVLQVSIKRNSVDTTRLSLRVRGFVILFNLSECRVLSKCIFQYIS